MCFAKIINDNHNVFSCQQDESDKVPRTSHFLLILPIYSSFLRYQVYVGDLEKPCYAINILFYAKTFQIPNISRAGKSCTALCAVRELNKGSRRESDTRSLCHGIQPKSQFIVTQLLLHVNQMKQIVNTQKKLLSLSSQENRAYQLLVDYAKVNVYCHMTDDLDSCGGGGWTMVMKMDGEKVSCFSSLLNLMQMFY